MLQIIRNAWNIKELRKKILYTLLLIVIFRFGSHIPVPAVDPAFIRSSIEQFTILEYLDIMSGGAFGDFTIFAMGISPYINASIIMNLLTIALPPLERMSKEGEEGRKKIERITKIVTLVFSFIMAIGILMGIGPNALIQDSIIPMWLSYLTIGLVISAGTAFLTWLADKISEIGIGNGTSFIIFAGIVARVPSTIIGTFRNAIDGSLNFWIIPIAAVLIVVIFAAVAFIDLGVRKVPVTYSKRVVGRKMYGGQNTHIPMKVNSNGVMPLIFAMTIIQVPAMIAQFWPNSGFTQFYTKYMGTGSVLYFVIYTLLIVVFSFFNTAISFNPIEMSKNMQANGGYIPGIRPGRATSDYLSKISTRLTSFSAVFLALVASLPTLFTNLLGQSAAAAFGATSLLIMVSTALETNKSLEAQLTMRHYKGFLK